MRNTLILALAATALVSGTLAQARPGDRLRARMGGANAAALVPQPAGKQTLSYGSDALQNLDFYPAANGNKRAPLVVFVHGGGWKRGSKEIGRASCRERVCLAV